MTHSAQSCFDQAAEQLLKADDPQDERDLSIRLDLSEHWRLLGIAVRGESPDLRPTGTEATTERSESWDHDERSPIGFRRSS